MPTARITWTPISHGSGTRTLDLNGDAVLYEYKGFVRPDVSQSFSKGGKVVTRTFDAWHEYTVEFQRLGPTRDATQFNLLTAWWAHAMQGGEFTFATDSGDVTDTLMDGAHVTTTTAVSVDTTTGMEDGDWLYIEAADSPLFFERNKIDTVDSGTTLTLLYGLRYDYPDNSIVRHAEYLPRCVAVPKARPPFLEREAGKGIAWDFDFTLRTVR